MLDISVFISISAKGYTLYIIQSEVFQSISSNCKKLHSAILKPSTGLFKVIYFSQQVVKNDFLNFRNDSKMLNFQ